MEKLNILGINLHKFRKKDLTLKLDEFLSSDKFNFIVTPNPEIILEAKKNEEFFSCINEADLSMPDGVGLKFAGFCLFSNLNRMTGADLTPDLLLRAERRGERVLILNWKKSLSRKEEIANYLNNNFSNLNYRIFEIDRDEVINHERIENYQPKIVFVTLGAPYQEFLIHKQLRKISSIRLAIGVGGAFDFLTQKIKRAPLVFRKLGLEWFWRIFQESRSRRLWRLKRIYNALIVFTLKFIKWRFVLPFMYRKNVVCLVFKKTSSGIKVFLAERRDEAGHWQLVQGGVDDNAIEVAAKKEINEEMNIENFKILRTTRYFYKYKFPKNNIHRGGVYMRHVGYKGQKQALAIAEYFGNNEEVKVNYWDHSGWKWVDLDDLVESVHEVRKEVTSKIVDIAKKEIKL